MKSLFTLVLLAFSTLGFAQNTGIVVGKVTDNAVNNEPLIYANISIKGTAIEASTDMTGLFHIENLADGDYTLICSFAGYETKELNIHVSAMEPTQIALSLNPSTVSLNDLAALGIDVAAAKDNGKTSVALNN
ncbi:hypothetical protein GCM10007962_04710 [Yeosuana aromativorans]|uniref:TonB-dependent receptor n=1 Tax=Yeosuana aromativorans TaxID=288019 RepID=A0A8J3FHA2_9FLAO|nr:carboxypeptidase-like regulatory domain-containing protein [Yeosuana aromativorans]GGK13458.1 hypothetical protein GCM10007962_04710 [Yeosuana aromativorans]